MKKILFICIVCLSICFNVSAKTEINYDYENMLSKLAAFEIIDNADYDYNDVVTRGEFAEILARTMGMNELAKSDYLSNVFVDVDSNSPQSAYINLLCEFGVINGYHGAIFSPDKPVTAEQAYKMILVALGYRDVAEKNGGYPTGYMAIALQNGITEGIASNVNEPLSMGMVVKMIDNALDVPMIIESPIGSGTYKKDVDSTFFNNILSNRKLIVKKGTVTGNQYGSFLEQNDIEAGQVEIDGNVYKTLFDDIYKLIGCKVTYYVENVSSSGMPIVYFAEPERTSMYVLEIKGDDIVSATMNNISYYNEEEKIEKVNLNAGVKLVYNGKPILSPTSLDILPVNGQIRLIDSNRDKNFDILFVTSCEYFTVDRTSVRNQAIFLKDGTLFGLRTITMDFTDKDFRGSITYDNGEKASIEDIMEGDVISVYHGRDQKQIDIKILRQKQEAVLKELDMTGTELTLDGNLYTLAKKENGENILPENGLILGKKYSFTVGEFGEIAYIEEVKTQNTQYGYVIDSEYRRGSREVSYVLVTENKEIEVYYMADRVMFNNDKMKKEELPLLTDCLIQFELDENNNICKLKESKAYGEHEEKQFNEETAIFSALNYGEPIFSNEETVVFLIPDSREEEDYKATIKLKDKDKYLIQAYDKDSITNAAGAILVYMNVFYDTPGFINADSSIAVLETVKYVYDDEKDEYVCNLNLLSDGEKKSIPVKNSPEMYNIVGKMCVADVFQYSLNSLGEIDNILTLAEFVPMPNLYHTGMMSSNEMIFGMAYDDMGGILAKGTKTSFVNYLTLKTDLHSDDTKSFLLSTSDEIYYYLYDRAEQQVDLASFDDIKSSISFGEDGASRVFIYSTDNEPKIVLIVQ